MRANNNLLLEVVMWCGLAMLATTFYLLQQPETDGPGRAQCDHNLKMLGLVLHNYHDEHGSLPAACAVGDDDQPLHSWRVAVLPWMERGDLYDRYAFDEPWDGPRNQTLHDFVPYGYQCPNRVASDKLTDYVAVTGEHTVWPSGKRMRIGDIKDGIANTLLLVETHQSGIHWMEPRDLPLDQTPLQINPKSQSGISSVHEGGAWILKADGAVQFLSNNVSPQVLRHLLEADDGHTVPPRSNQP